MHHSYAKWQPVIGLEIHIQLKTRTKLFSQSLNRFGDEPNTNIDVVNTGQPGSLPVLNREAVEKAVLFGSAIKAKISPFSRFERKSYFYPDSPRNYQITQFDNPIIVGGVIIADVAGETKEFSVHHAHLEDDAGMLKHFSDFAGVDYNRAGVPLLEVVSNPCIFSAKDATAYAMAMRAIAQYLGVSDCNMEEGSFRIDTNVSVRPIGDSVLRNKVEVKNMNSFANMEMAIESEIARQVHAYQTRPHEDPKKVVTSQTMRLDLERKKTVPMRFKEAEADYRYFPEPDLPPLVLSQKFIDGIRKEMPELPHERFNRYVKELELTEYNASILINDKELSDYFEEALRHCNNASSLCNWITVEFVGRLKESGTPLYRSKILAKQVATLVNCIEEKKITGRIAKQVADIMVQVQGKDPETIIEDNSDFQPIHDTSAIELFVNQALTENIQSLEDFKAGKDKAFNYLVGQVMKLSKGKASPEIVKELLMQKIQT